MYFITLTYEGLKTGDDCFSICESKFPIRGRFPGKKDFNYFEKIKFNFVKSTNQELVNSEPGPELKIRIQGCKNSSASG